MELTAKTSPTDKTTSYTDVSAAYADLIACGGLSDDPAQRIAVQRFAEISDQLAATKGNGGIAGFFRRRREAPKGLYIWGGVGQGKTLLMDLFFESVPMPHKRRVHFHEFMDEIHQKIANIRAKSTKLSKINDPIAEVAKPIIRDVRLLCFDEFHVSDITNAMLLGRLFEKFFAAGMVVVATSNVAPDGLYKDGLNRALFLPFIDLLKNHCDVMHLEAATDYRRDKLSSQPVFHFGSPQQVRDEMDQLWSRFIGGQKDHSSVVEVLGRQIIVPHQAMGMARFDFADLCDRPLGARDYLALSHQFHTLVIDDVPQFIRENSNAAKRFILLIDTLYDRGVKLAASFAVPLTQLSGDKDTAFEFRRTESRLAEMASDVYLSAPRNLNE